MAEGKELPMNQATVEARMMDRGHAIEARIYAEDPDMGFIPDSGRLVHLHTPRTSEYVRIDAGFIAGDEVSSHYDPMIAKLIVRGESRTIAIKKLLTALEDYEVVGLSTNIDFLRRICKTEAFLSGDVETGFISKHSDELFRNQQIEPEVFAQAALGSVFHESAKTPFSYQTGILQPGFRPESKDCTFHIAVRAKDQSAKSRSVSVRVTMVNAGLFNIEVEGKTFRSVASSYDSASQSLETYFPHTRLVSRFIRDGKDVTVFQRGENFRLQIADPKWLETALGIKEPSHSVLAPMPCKILKVEVQAGQEVKVSQPLVVIESMKMETVIRSPKAGVVKRVVHKKGVCAVQMKTKGCD